MNKITGFSVLTTGEGERVTLSYSVLDADGNIVSTNNRKNYVVLDEDVLTAIAAIVMRSRLIDNKSASSSTRIVATAFTGRIKTHAVTAIVTMICVKALIRISPQLLSAAAYCRIPPASPP